MFQACRPAPGAKLRRARLFLDDSRLDFLDYPPTARPPSPIFSAISPDTFILATCRRHQNHGRFNGSIEEQLAILELAIASGAQAVDVEIETAEACEERVAQFRGRALVVVSYHNFEATPPMDTVVARAPRPRRRV